MDSAHRARAGPKKDEFSTRMRSVWDNFKEVRSDNAAVISLKERTATLEQQLKSAGEERKELARELQRLRERLAAVEGRQPAGQP